MHHDSPAVMLFAAGFGTRMLHLTADRPKPLIPVAGRALIDHALALTAQVGADPVVANLHYLPDQMETHLSAKNVQTLRETPDILETGGGLRNALPLLGDGPVVTLNTDAIWAGPNPISLLLNTWRPQDMDALLMCVPLAHVHGRTGGGDFDIAPDGHLKRGGDTIYGGVQILKTDLLHDVADTAFSLNVVWNMMVARNRFFGMQYPGHWCDVGHPGGIADAEHMLAQHNV